MKRKTKSELFEFRVALCRFCKRARTASEVSDHFNISRGSAVLYLEWMFWNGSILTISEKNGKNAYERTFSMRHTRAILRAKGKNK